MKRSASGRSFSAASSGTLRHSHEGTVSSSTFLQAGRHAGFAEIFLRQHVGGDLRPLLRHFDVLGVEHDGTVRIADLARGQTEVDVRVGRLSLFGVAPLDPHFLPLKSWCFGIGGLRIQYRTPTISPRRSGRIPRRRPHPCFCLPPNPSGFWQAGSLVWYVRPRTPRGSPSRAQKSTLVPRRHGALPQTLFGEPGGLRYPRAELSKARPSRARASSFSMNS